MRWDTLYAKKTPVKKRNAPVEETPMEDSPAASENDESDSIPDGQLDLFHMMNNV